MLSELWECLKALNECEAAASLLQSSTDTLNQVCFISILAACLCVCVGVRALVCAFPANLESSCLWFRVTFCWRWSWVMR